jgi:hypothetical protein
MWMLIFLSTIKLLTIESPFNTLKRSLPICGTNMLFSTFPFEISRSKEKLTFFLLSMDCSSILLRVICCFSLIAFFSSILIAGKYFVQSDKNFPSLIIYHICAYLIDPMGLPNALLHTMVRYIHLPRTILADKLEL